MFNAASVLPAGPGERDDNAFPLRERLRFRDNLGLGLRDVRQRPAFAALAKGPWSLFIAIAVHWQGNAEAWPSQETLARFSGWSTRAVRDQADTLARGGFIRLRRERRGDGSERIFYTPGLVTLVSHIAELPLVPLEHVPGLGPIVKGVSPFQTWDHIADAVKKGDLKALENIAKQQLSLAQGVVSLIPGIGTGISMAISAGLAVLEGGGALEVAIKTAYGALPIPPGIRQVTDVVLDTVLDLAFHHESLTDVVVNVARDQVPAGFPRDVYDTLVNIVVKHKPIVKVAGGLVDHFVQQYAPKGLGIDLQGALSGAVGHLPNMLAALPPGVPQGPGHVFAPLHGGIQAPRVHLDLRGAHIQVPPQAATPSRLPASPRMVQPLRTAIA